MDFFRDQSHVEKNELAVSIMMNGYTRELTGSIAETAPRGHPTHSALSLVLPLRAGRATVQLHRKT